jgi:hypothetical protein
MAGGLCVVAISAFSAPLALLASGIGIIASAVVASIVAGRRNTPGSLRSPTVVLVLVALGPFSPAIPGAPEDFVENVVALQAGMAFGGRSNG